MGNALMSRLRERNPELSAALTTVNNHSELISSLTLANVLSVATIMWSFNILNDEELDEVMSLTASRKASKKLLKRIFAKGDTGIKGLASALQDIEKPELAEKLKPAVAINSVIETPATEESLHGSENAATDIGGYARLTENLINNIDYIASRLTTGDTDSIIVKLRSHKEKYLQVLDYEDLKEIKGATRKATELIDKLLKNERAIPYFAKSLKDIGRPELCDVIRNGRAA